MQEITDIVQIKHEVLCATARHAFQGDLHEAYDKIPYEIIKGIKPNFRCCVYRAVSYTHLDQRGKPAVAGDKVVGDGGDQSFSGGVDDPAAHHPCRVAAEAHAGG